MMKCHYLFVPNSIPPAIATMINSPTGVDRNPHNAVKNSVNVFTSFLYIDGGNSIIA